MRSRDRDVVLVRRTIDLGCWEFGMGRVWAGDGEGEVSLRAIWGQGGRDRITPKEGFQVSKREMEVGVTKNQQGE
jgi:hypothetical protein